MLSDVFNEARVKGSAASAVFCLRALSPAALRSVARQLAAVLVVASLLSGPALAFGSKGQKNFRRGVEYESAQQWEKAVEEFALAVAAEPSNAEYQLHYRRAVFNVSQLLMQQGATLSERGDYVGAYNAYRRAYAYDQSNELARSLTERMFQLQLEKDGGTPAPESHKTALRPVANTSPTAYKPGAAQVVRASQQDELAQPGRSEQLRVITYSGDLQAFIKYLTRQLRLNAVFDKDFPQRGVSVDLQDVTAAQALDYVFLTQGLFFQKLSSRTILVAEQTKRPQYQQLVLRTFYLSNSDPNEVKTLIQASIPPQAGRQPVITANKTTNSITVRDTVENVRLVADLIKSVDKDRAEVVMDVQIYEVSRTDLMQLGNQIGGESSLTNLGGIQKGLNVLGGNAGTLASLAGPTALGAALLVPSSALSAFQRRDNTRLIASTQVHAFDGEKSTAHIGQRVPVQTATVTPFGGVGSGGDNNAQPGVNPGLFGGNGYPVIQYEKTGLTLEFTPQVSPELDVQVKMSIKSNDVTGVASSGTANLTPTFTERNIEGTARIQNNRTMMIASVAQNQQSRGRQGLPLLGLMPVLGRVFTAPRRNDQQTDIVIAVTPHVLRAPSYSPQDEEMRPSGTMQTPASESLEAMLHEVERDEQLAAARALPRHTEVQISEDTRPASAVHSTSGEHTTSDARAASDEQPTFVPAPKILMNSAAAVTPAVKTDNAVLDSAPVNDAAPLNTATTAVATRPRNVEAKYEVPSAPRPAAEAPAPTPEPAHAPAETPTPSPAVASASTEDAPRAQTNTGSFSAGGSLFSAAPAKPSAQPAPVRSAAQLMLMPEPQAMAVGERRQLKLVLKTDAPLGMVAASLRFDPKLFAARSVTHGNIFTGPSRPAVNFSASPEGLLIFSISPAAGASAFSGGGILLNIEVEALATGASAFDFAAEDVHLLTTDGRKVFLKVLPGAVTVR